MCMQCMSAAMVAGSAAAGSRWWLVRTAHSWLTPRRKKLITGVLLACGVLAAGLLGGSGA
jgi:hypothetical protein